MKAKVEKIFFYFLRKKLLRNCGHVKSYAKEVNK